MSATTTFSRLEAANTMTSATSSGDKGSHPLPAVSSAYAGEMNNVRIHGIRLCLVAPVANSGELLGVLSLRAHSGRSKTLTVKTWPGSTVMTRILVAMSSLRRASVKARTAALLAQ